MNRFSSPRRAWLASAFILAGASGFVLEASRASVDALEVKPGPSNVRMAKCDTSASFTCRDQNGMHKRKSLVPISDDDGNCVLNCSGETGTCRLDGKDCGQFRYYIDTNCSNPVSDWAMGNKPGWASACD